MALVIGTEGVDLSVGATIALAASIIPLYLGYGPAPAIARAKVLVYLLSGTLAGAAGALSGARLGSDVTTVGVGYELTAIASVVIGGTLLTGGYGTVGGTVCGVLLLAVIHHLIDRYLSQYGSAMTDAVNGAFLALVVLAQAALERSRRR